MNEFREVPCPLCGSGEAVPLLQVLSRRMVRCRACGLVYRSPRPVGSVVARSPDADRTDRELEERVGERRSRHFRRFLARAGRPGRLLDIGCGYGFFVQLAQEAGWDAIGLDPDPEAVAYAQARLRVNARCGELGDCCFPDGAFDLVTLWNVLECVPDPLGLLREVHRVLAPGGRVFIRTQNVAWHLLNFRLARTIRRLAGRPLVGTHPYRTFIFNMNSFSRPTLHRLIERSGIVPRRVRNSRPILGDPYVGVGPGTERLMSLAKLGVHGLVQSLALVSGGRWLVGPSLEAWGWREPGR